MSLSVKIMLCCLFGIDPLYTPTVRRVMWYMWIWHPKSSATRLFIDRFCRRPWPCHRWIVTSGFPGQRTSNREIAIMRSWKNVLISLFHKSRNIGPLKPSRYYIKLGCGSVTRNRHTPAILGVTGLLRCFTVKIPGWIYGKIGRSTQPRLIHESVRCKIAIFFHSSRREW